MMNDAKWPALPLDAYDEVRRAADPESTLLDFSQSAYDAAAELGRWDRRSLER